MAGAIAKEIRVKMMPHEQAQLAFAPVVDPEAHDAYLHEGCGRALGWGYLETPNFQPVIAETYAVAGYNDEARQILWDLQQRSTHQYVMPYMIGRVYAALGQIDEAFGRLEAAYEEHGAWMVIPKRDPRLDKSSECEACPKAGTHEGPDRVKRG